MPTLPRILIADDHFLMAELCKRLLEAEFEVLRIVSDGRELVFVAKDLKPDLIVIDIAMPLLNGLDAGSEIKLALPAVKLVFLTMHADIDLAADAIRRGAQGYLLKTCAATELLSAVRIVLRGGSFVSRELCIDRVNEAIWRQRRRTDFEVKLTKRQRQVLQLLAEGKVMKEVSDILHTTPRNIAYHKYRLMRTLGVRSTAELVRHAVRLRLIAA